MTDARPERPAPPDPPERIASEDWDLVEETTETVFRLLAMRFEGHILLYEDAALRRALATVAPDFDGPWRFFFTTRLAFVPPLAPGIGMASVYPAVAGEAADTFESELRGRGFEGSSAVVPSAFAWTRATARDSSSTLRAMPAKQSTSTSRGGPPSGAAGDRSRWPAVPTPSAASRRSSTNCLRTTGRRSMSAGSATSCRPDPRRGVTDGPVSVDPGMCCVTVAGQCCANGRD